MCLVSAASGLLVVVYVFTGFEPKYRCAVPLCENVSTANYGIKHEDGAGISFPDFVEVGIPTAALDKSNLCQYYGIRQEVLESFFFTFPKKAVVTVVKNRGQGTYLS